MKVKCIKNMGRPLLTIGKIYDADKFIGLGYSVINDKGNYYHLGSDFFEDISEIREDKLKQLGI